MQYKHSKHVAFLSVFCSLFIVYIVFASYIIIIIFNALWSKGPNGLLLLLLLPCHISRTSGPSVGLHSMLRLRPSYK